MQCCDQAGRYEHHLCNAATFVCVFRHSAHSQPSIKDVQYILFSGVHVSAMPLGAVKAMGKVWCVSALHHSSCSGCTISSNSHMYGTSLWQCKVVDLNAADVSKKTTEPSLLNVSLQSSKELCT